MEKFLYHAIRFKNMDTLYKIVESGFILPRCMIKGSESFDRNNIFNGTRYISLTDKTRSEGIESSVFKSSYDDWIVGSLCIVIQNLEKVITPTLLDWDNMGPEDVRPLLFKDGPTRYSYFIDEVQTDKRIPTSYFVAIGYPNYHFKYDLGVEGNDRQLQRLKEFLLSHGIDIPIVDSNAYDFADDREKIKIYTLVK